MKGMINGRKHVKPSRFLIQIKENPSPLTVSLCPNMHDDEIQKGEL